MRKMYRYIVEYYDEYKDEETLEKGILAASNYNEAIALLTSSESGYGGELISVKLIDLCDTILSDADLAIDLKRD